MHGRYTLTRSRKARKYSHDYKYRLHTNIYKCSECEVTQNAHNLNLITIYFTKKL